jgi:putative PIN family toxin of toxin-antitoxin system
MQVPQIVIDTNVMVAGLRSRQGYSYQLLSRVGQGYFDINLSVPLVFEYEEILLKQEKELLVNIQTIEDVIDYHCRVGTHHRIFYLWRPLLNDPDDEMILELAVRAACDSIVTYNKADFKGVDKFGMNVQTPAEFLKTINN